MNELDEIEYIDAMVNLMTTIKTTTAKDVAQDMWEYYPKETILLLDGLNKARNVKKIPRLLMSKH